MRIISVFNEQGAVGKTTVTANLGAGLSKLGQRVLLIDFDPVKRLTHALGIRTNGTDTFYDFLTGDVKLRDVIERCGSFDIIPSDRRLVRLNANKIECAISLREELRALGSYDFILIDCPPAFGIINDLVLNATGEIYIPVVLDYPIIEEMEALAKIIGAYEAANEDLKATKIVINRYQSESEMSLALERSIRDKCGELVFETRIGESVEIEMAMRQTKNVIEYDPYSRGAVDFFNFSLEVLKRQ